MTEGRLMKDDTLPLHTNSLASRNAQKLQVPTKALEAADVSSTDSQTTKQPNCIMTNWKSARMRWDGITAKFTSKYEMIINIPCKQAAV